FAFAESPLDLFKSANALYGEGKFSEAAQKYQKAADQGMRNWLLEYNLGNAYYRASQNGRAVLHYDGAFHLDLRQADWIYNLNLATQKAGEPELPAGALSALAWRLFYGLSVNALTLLTSLLFIFFCAAAGAALLGKRIISGEAALGLGFLWV